MKLTILAKIELKEGWTLAPYPGDPSGELFLVIDGKYHSPVVSWLGWDEIQPNLDGSLGMMVGKPVEGLDEEIDDNTTEFHSILEKD